MRRKFFPRRRHRIPYSIILIVAVLAFLVVMVLAFQLMMPGCRGA